MLPAMYDNNFQGGKIRSKKNNPQSTFFFCVCVMSDGRVHIRECCRVGPACLAGREPACRDGELPAHVSKDFVQLGRFPSDVALPARGSSRSEAAKALCAATARRLDHRATHADRAADCIAAGAADARWRASKRSHVAASVLNRPPTSTPTTTKRQRRARTSSGYVWRRLRRAAPTRAWPGRATVPEREAIGDNFDAAVV